MSFLNERECKLFCAPLRKEDIFVVLGGETAQHNKNILFTKRQRR